MNEYEFNANYFCHLGQHGTATSHRTYQVSTGYVEYSGGKKSCFKCVGIKDRKDFLSLPIGEKLGGYLTQENGTYYFANWPGTFKVRCFLPRTSRTNWGLKRLDTWFILQNENGEQQYYWVKNINQEWNQTAQAKRIKSL